MATPQTFLRGTTTLIFQDKEETQQIKIFGEYLFLYLGVNFSLYLALKDTIRISLQVTNQVKYF